MHLLIYNILCSTSFGRFKAFIPKAKINVRYVGAQSQVVYDHVLRAHQARVNLQKCVRSQKREAKIVAVQLAERIASYLFQLIQSESCG